MALNVFYDADKAMKYILNEATFTHKSVYSSQVLYK